MPLLPEDLTRAFVAMIEVCVPPEPAFVSPDGRIALLLSLIVNRIPPAFPGRDLLWLLLCRLALLVPLLCLLPVSDVRLPTSNFVTIT